MKTGKETRICIIGAGPSGVVAGDTLRKLGYKNITILEKHPSAIGGKCHTVKEDNVPLDIGAIYVFPHYPVVNQYIKETGCHLVEALPFVFIEKNGKTRPFGTPPAPIPFTSRIRENFNMAGQLFFKYNNALKFPLGEVKQDIMNELSIPVGEWIKKYKLRHFHEAAFPIMRSFGFGYEEQEISAIYSFQVLYLMAHQGNLLSLMNIPGLKLHTVKEGYGEVWRRAAEPLDVQLGVEIKSVKRHEHGVTVNTADETCDFDKLILACGLDNALEFLDIAQEEKELFKSIKSIDVWQARFKAKGVNNGFILEGNQGYDQIGYGMGGLRYGLDSDWIYYFGYTDSSIAKDDIAAAIKKDVHEKMGAEMISEPVFKSWKAYFPHFSPADVQAGHHARLEKLQGQNNTYLTGALLANNGVEWAASHAQKLIQKHFS